MSFYDINNNRVLCIHTLLMGWLTILGFGFASIKDGYEKDVYLMVGLGSMILFILSLYQLRATYNKYYNYTYITQHLAIRETKVRFEDEDEEEEHNGIMHV